MLMARHQKIAKLFDEEFWVTQLRSQEVTKNKGVFPSDTALEKLVYLAYRDISGKWTMPLSNWALISQQLAIKFGDRFKIM